MHDTNTLTHDIPLTSGGAEGEMDFLHKLRQLLNFHGVDNACGTPDYILADLLKEHLRTWRFYATARDLHAGYPSSLNTEQGARVVNTYLGAQLRPLKTCAPLSHPDGVIPVRCENCDGRGFISPLQATPTPTLQRWLKDLSEQKEIDVTTLTDQERAIILHAYDWSDQAEDTALQRAGRKLILQGEHRPVTKDMLHALNVGQAGKPAKEKGGEDAVH